MTDKAQQRVPGLYPTVQPATLLHVVGLHADASTFQQNLVVHSAQQILGDLEHQHRFQETSHAAKNYGKK